MSANPDTGHGPAPLIQSFPDPGPLLRLAYRELSIAANGTKEQTKALGDIRLLPRPWDPATCRKPELREQLWAWLDAVVTWLNAEYVWDVDGAVPACWPRHPHLVHEIAVLADQRRRAGAALSSDVMEEWHRYCLPAFVDRMRSRVRNHCEEGHQPWPAKGRHTRHTNHDSQHARAEAFTQDVRSVAETSRTHVPPATPRLSVVDLNTGEIKDT